MRLTFGILTLTTVVLTIVRKLCYFVDDSHTLQVVLPPWPMFNRYPVKWLAVENVVGK